jgi:UDP-sugar transporter A1/2/3
MIENNNKNKIFLKYFSLVALTLQSTLIVVFIRYSRKNASNNYLPSTVVLFSEIVKLVICLIIVFINSGLFYSVNFYLIY